MSRYLAKYLDSINPGSVEYFFLALYIILSLYICINIQHQRVWNKADLALVIKTVRYVLPPHFYIRNRIVQWAFDPAFAMMAHDV